MKTVAGMFEDEAASRAKTELGAAGFTAVTLRTKARGGTLSDLVASGIPAHEANQYIDEMAEGGTLVTVDCNDADAPKALAILDRIGARAARRARLASDDAALRAKRAAELEAARGPTRPGDVIPIVEEKVAIDKQAFDAGGVRIHARMVESPV